jgi:DNA-binding Lrp family transcriptional regulator
VNQLDSTDINILNALQADGRIPITQLSDQLGIPHATIRDRIRKLERSGVIQGYKAVINPEKAGLLISCLVQITIDQRLELDIEDTIDTLLSIDQVSQFFVLTGETDIAVLIHARDVDHLRTIIYDKLKAVPGFERENTGVVLATGSKPINLVSHLDCSNR